MLEQGATAFGLALVAAGGTLPWLGPDSLTGAQAWVTAVASAVSGISVLLLRFRPDVALLVAVLMVAVFQGWLRADGDPEALRHVVRLSASLFAMTLVARCRVERRMSWMVLAYLAVGLVVVTIAFSALDFTPYNAKVLPAEVNRWLSETPVTLPGVPGGRVNPNALGAAILLFLPLSLVALAWPTSPGVKAVVLRRVGAAFLVWGGAVLVVSQSRSAWLGAGVEVLLFTALFAARAPRRLVAALGAVSLVVLIAGGVWFATQGVTVVDSPSIQHRVDDRLEIWRQGSELLRRSPMGGIGFGQFEHHYVALRKVGPGFSIGHSHNVFLQAALDTGLIGAAAYAALIGVLLATACRVANGLDGPARLAGAAGGLALLGVHVFGLTDAVALGATIGVFQWVASGFILMASAVQAQATPSRP